MTSSNGNISAVLAIWAGNSPVTGEFLSQMPVTQSFDAFFDLRLNKRMCKQCWRHCNGNFCLIGYTLVHRYHICLLAYENNGFACVIVSLHNKTPCFLFPSRFLLQWRHNGRDCVANQQPHHCLLRRRSKKNSKAPRHWHLCHRWIPRTNGL